MVFHYFRTEILVKDIGKSWPNSLKKVSGGTEKQLS